MLSVDSLKKIDREIAKYPPERKQSAVMSALIVARTKRAGCRARSWTSSPANLGMPPVAVYEVATFYAMYNLEPVGTYKLTLCTNLPCGLQGALDAADHLRRKLRIDFNETTPDGHFTLKEGECFGACAMAPVLLVNNKKMHRLHDAREARSALEELGRK